MKTYNVNFKNSENGNDEGFSLTEEEAIKVILSIIKAVKFQLFATKMAKQFTKNK